MVSARSGNRLEGKPVKAVLVVLEVVVDYVTIGVGDLAGIEGVEGLLGLLRPLG